MRHAADQRLEPAQLKRAERPLGPRSPRNEHVVLYLQRSAGNRATSQLLSGRPTAVNVQRIWPFTGHGYIWNRAPSTPPTTEAAAVVTEEHPGSAHDEEVTGAEDPATAVGVEEPAPAPPTNSARRRQKKAAAKAGKQTITGGGGKEEALKASGPKPEEVRSTGVAKINELETLASPYLALFHQSVGLTGADFARAGLLELLTVVGTKQVEISRATTVEGMQTPYTHGKGILGGKTIAKHQRTLELFLNSESADAKGAREVRSALASDLALLKHRADNPIVKAALNAVDPSQGSHREYNLAAEHTNNEVRAAQRSWEDLGHRTQHEDMEGIGPVRERGALMNLHVPGGPRGVKAKKRGAAGIQVNGVLAANLGPTEFLIHIHATKMDEDRTRAYWLDRRAADAITDEQHVYRIDVPATFDPV